MVTKQQALEFIYELSQRYHIILDIPHEYIFVHNKAYCNESTLESLVEKVIINNLNGTLFKHMKRIPVTIDMLEVGQTYKVEFLDFTGVPNSFTEKLLSITEEDKPVFNFSNGYYTKYIDIKEIYKVNECIN